MAEFLRRGRPFGVGEGAELAGAVVADRVDADDLAVLGQLHRPRDDADVDGSAGPPAAARVRCPGEADHPAAVGEPGHGQSGGGVPGPASHPRLRFAVRLADAQPLRVRGDHYPGVQNVHQPPRRRRPRPARRRRSRRRSSKPGQRDLAVRVHPPRHPHRSVTATARAARFAKSAAAASVASPVARPARAVSRAVIPFTGGAGNPAERGLARRARSCPLRGASGGYPAPAPPRAEHRRPLTRRPLPRPDRRERRGGCVPRRRGPGGPRARRSRSVPRRCTGTARIVPERSGAVPSRAAGAAG